MASGAPDWHPRVISSDEDLEQGTVAVGILDVNITFTQQCHSILIFNDGPLPVHFNRDAAAIITHFMIPSKAWMMIDVPTTSAHFIAAGAGPTTIYAIGIY